MQSNDNQRGEDLHPPAAPPIFDTKSLFGNEREIVITHEGVDYRLKITRQNKLILNK